MARGVTMMLFTFGAGTWGLSLSLFSAIADGADFSGTSCCLEDEQPWDR